MKIQKNKIYVTDCSDLSVWVHNVIDLGDWVKIKITLSHKKLGYVYEERKWYKIAKSVPVDFKWRVHHEEERSH